MDYNIKLYITDEQNNKFFGYGPVELLKKIDETHSLNSAAKEMGLSYTKALRMINDAEKGLNCKLITRVSGGRDGGGSYLTEEAAEHIRRFSLFKAKVNEAAGEIFKEIYNRQ